MILNVSKRIVARIGIAIVLHHDQLVVGLRGEGVHLSGMHEFPGGKCEPSETAEECAVRECLEETGLRVFPVQVLHQELFEYPDRTVDLTFVLCHLERDQAPEELFAPFFWVLRNELGVLTFPAGNKSVLRCLQEWDGGP